MYAILWRLEPHRKIEKKAGRGHLSSNGKFRSVHTCQSSDEESALVEFEFHSITFTSALACVLGILELRHLGLTAVRERKVVCIPYHITYVI